MNDSNICECGHPIYGSDLSERHGMFGCLHVIGPSLEDDGNVLCSCKRENPSEVDVVWDVNHHLIVVYTGRKGHYCKFCDVELTKNEHGGYNPNCDHCGRHWIDGKKLNGANKDELLLTAADTRFLRELGITI